MLANVFERSSIFCGGRIPKGRFIKLPPECFVCEKLAKEEGEQFTSQSMTISRLTLKFNTQNLDKIIAIHFGDIIDEKFNNIMNISSWDDTTDGSRHFWK
jgi:hypothetical protein